MNDLINRQEAIDALDRAAECWNIAEPFNEGMKAGYKAAVTIVLSLPSAQPERKMGRWLTTDAYPHNVYCSECYKTFAQTHWAVWEDGTLPRNFCPNCGAKMEVSE